MGSENINLMANELKSPEKRKAYSDFTNGLMVACDEIEANLYAVDKMQSGWVELGADDTITMELMEEFLRGGYFLRTAKKKLSDLRDELDESYFTFGKRVDDLDKPAVDMSASALQAHSIQNALVALAQIIPEDQPDVLGSIKTIIKMAHDLSSHLITGGQYRLFLKEALEEAGPA